MADSEASGEARLDDPVDGPVDTDRLVVDPSESIDAHAGPPRAEWIEPAPPTEAEQQTFDAFDANTWRFTPTPTPWYRTGHTTPVVVAVSIAVVALVVSIVLLAFRATSDGVTAPTPRSETTVAPTTVTTPSTTSEAPLPPPPPPPPPTASQIDRAPVVVSQPPRQTKKPEFNVTRSPLSVSPQKPTR